MDNPIVLSICIPTYNNVSSLYRSVSDILKCNDPDIEIVVLDNGSTDDTLLILHDINDVRLHVYTNGENKGALFNMVNVLNKGRGKYLVYLTDHDYIDYEKIGKYKLFLLENPNISCGYCEFNSNSNILFELFDKGYQSISKIAYMTRHPTGYFFQNDHLRSLNIVDRFSDYEFVHLFPLEFIFAELCLLGDGAIYHDSIFTPETGEKVVKHKSATTNGNSQKAFFSPQTRLKLAINFEEHIGSLQISEREKEQLKIESFFRELNSATFGYKYVMNKEDICIHYFMDPRNVGINELISIGSNFYKEYYSKVLRVRYKSASKRLNFKLKLFSIFFLKLLKKLFHL